MLIKACHWFIPSDIWILSFKPYFHHNITQLHFSLQSDACLPWGSLTRIWYFSFLSHMHYMSHHLWCNHCNGIRWCEKWLHSSLYNFFSVSHVFTSHKLKYLLQNSFQMPFLSTFINRSYSKVYMGTVFRVVAPCQGKSIQIFQRTYCLNHKEGCRSSETLRCYHSDTVHTLKTLQHASSLGPTNPNNFIKFPLSANFCSAEFEALFSTD
jgi:hypothetical protein